MKKCMFLLAAIIFSLAGYAQKEKDLARVKKINGVEAYIMCEPLRDYETIVDVNTGIKAESLLTGGLVNKSISGKVEQFISRAKKQNGTIDAVIYTSGKRIVGIKFKGESTARNKGLGRVSKMNGHPVFVMSEPLLDYEVLTSKGGGIKWKSAITGGVVNNSIEEDVEKIVNKLNNVGGVDAFLFSGSKTGVAISFKD